MVVLFICSCKLNEKLFQLPQQITDAEAQEVKNICSNLKPPPSFIKKHEFDIVKSHAANRSINYSSRATKEEVEEYFVNLLTKSGWSYRKERGGGADTLGFRKGKYAINIESPNYLFNANKIYSVDCSIGLH